MSVEQGTGTSTDPAATERIDIEQRGIAGKGRTAVNTYVMSKLVEYKQHDLARESGRRDWAKLFRK
jgi:hypothetical protein